MGSTCNHQNEGKTNNLGGMLYLVYAVLGVCCTRCQLMNMTWRDREGWLNLVFGNDGRVVDENERDERWRWEWCGRYKRSWGIGSTSCLIGMEVLVMVLLHEIGTSTCHIRDGELTRTQTSLKSQFLMMISPMPSHLSLSRRQLYHHLRTSS